MDSTAHPAGREPERVTVTRQSLVRLCDFIKEYAAAEGIKENAAASELARTFREIERSCWGYASDLASNVAWLSIPSDQHHDCGVAVTAGAVADYFHSLATKSRTKPEAITLNYANSYDTVPASDALVMFAPEPLARLLEDAGEPVPKFLQDEPPAAESQPAPPASKLAKPVTTRKTKAAPPPKEKPMDARELTSTRRLMRAFVQIIAAAAQDERPEVRQLAATLSLEASPYTTAGQVMRLADLIGAPLPANQKTIEKFLADPDDL